MATFKQLCFLIAYRLTNDALLLTYQLHKSRAFYARQKKTWASLWMSINLRKAVGPCPNNLESINVQWERLFTIRKYSRLLAVFPAADVPCNQTSHQKKEKKIKKGTTWTCVQIWKTKDEVVNTHWLPPYREVYQNSSQKA